MNFTDLERQRNEFLKKQQQVDLDCVHCPKCNSQWFEEVACYRYKSSHNIILGQNVPPRPGSIPYFLLRCIVCSNLLEPRVMHNTRDIGSADYDTFLDTLEGKHDSRESEKDVVSELQQTIKGLEERIALFEQSQNTTTKKDKDTKKRKKLEVPSEKL